MERFEEIPSIENSESGNAQDDFLETNTEEILFSEYFSSLGYKKHEALPLAPPESDETVPFVGSSINVFKKYLESRTDIETPSFVLQPCIRTHDIINGYNLSNIPFGMPFFHIYGTFNRQGTYEKTAIDVMGYLRDAHKINNENVLIKPTVPELSKKLLAPFIAAGANIEIDNSRYYEWKYGINNISGHGVTLFICDKNKRWWDVGNVVSIFGENNQEIAVEFGIGLEFLETAVLGYNDPFEASHIAKIVKSENPFHKKVLTNLEVALAASGTLATTKARTIRMSNRYINIAHYLCEEYGYSREEVEHIANEYKNIATTQVDVELFLEKYDARIKVFDGLKSVFTNFLQNPIYTDINHAREQLSTYLKKKGIRNEELKLYIDKNYKNNNKIELLCKNV